MLPHCSHTTQSKTEDDIELNRCINHKQFKKDLALQVLAKTAKHIKHAATVAPSHWLRVNNASENGNWLHVTTD